MQLALVDTYQDDEPGEVERYLEIAEDERCESYEKYLPHECLFVDLDLNPYDPWLIP